MSSSSEQPLRRAISAEVADLLDAWADRPCAAVAAAEARPDPAGARALARRVREDAAAGRVDPVLVIDATRELVNRMTDAEWAEYDALGKRADAPPSISD